METATLATDIYACDNGEISVLIETGVSSHSTTTEAVVVRVVGKELVYPPRGNRIGVMFESEGTRLRLSFDDITDFFCQCLFAKTQVFDAGG